MREAGDWRRLSDLRLWFLPQSRLCGACVMISGLQFHPDMLAQTSSELMPVEYRRQTFDQNTLDIPELPLGYLKYIGDDLAAYGYT